MAAFRNAAKTGIARRMARSGWSVGDIASVCKLTKAEVLAIVSTAPPAPVPPAVREPAADPNWDRLRRVRWFRRWGLPAAHIAVVMDMDESAIDALLARRVGNGRWKVKRPAVPIQAKRHTRHQVGGGNATLIRRLASLGYDPSLIDPIMLLAPGVAARFLDSDRRKEERARRQRERRSQAPEPPTWKRTDSRLDSAGWIPPLPLPLPAIAAAEVLDLVNDQAVAELPAAELENPPPADGPAWSDPRSLRGSANGQSKLTAADVLEIRELHAAGRSIYSLAPEWGVSKSAIRAIVRRETWAELPSPAPPATGPVESDDRQDPQR
jgi:hypothetical protein